MINSQSSVEFVQSRQGIASLEVVMALPIIMLLWMFIFWVGLFFLNYTEVTIGARREAWIKRDQPRQSADAFDFGKIDAVSETQRRPTKFGPFGQVAVEHTHEALVGSWDYRTIPLDRQMHWELYTRLGGRMLEGKLTQFRDLRRLMSGLTSGESAASALGAGGQLGGIVSQHDTLNGALGQKLEAGKLAGMAKINEFKDNVRQLESDRKRILDSETKLATEVDGLQQALERDKQEKKLTAEMKQKMQSRINEIQTKERPDLEKQLAKVGQDIDFYRTSAASQEAILNNLGQ